METMSLGFEISPTDVADGPLVAVGPAAAQVEKVLLIPQFFERRVTYSEPSLVVTLQCEFSGERYEIRRITVEGSGTFVSSRDLTQMKLPALMRAMALEAVPDAAFWSRELQKLAAEKSSNYSFLAQVYWFETITWGNPRMEIMQWMGVARTTANENIRKLAKLFSLPGGHSSK